eukprot:scaffold57419_cov20-Tisochrysis_lutea.AAC.1
MSKISGVLECALNLGASCILACSLPLIIGGAPSTAPSCEMSGNRVLQTSMNKIELKAKFESCKHVEPLASKCSRAGQLPPPKKVSSKCSLHMVPSTLDT